MPRKTLLPGLLVLALLLSACTFQPVTVTPSPALPQGISQPGNSPEEPEEEPGEEAETPTATEEIPLPPEAEADDPWADLVPQSGDLLLWYALPPQTPVDLAFNHLVDDFNASNEYGVTLYAFNLSTPEAVLSRTLPLLGTPDVPALIALTPEQEAVYADDLLPLNSLLDSPSWGIPAEERSAWTDVFLLTGETLPGEESEIRSLPIGTDSRGLAFNMDWMARLGSYNAPATPQEFAALVCKAVARPYRPEGEPTGYAFVPSLESLRAWTQVFGGALYNVDDGMYHFEQPAAQEALSFLRDLYAQGCISLAQDAAAAQDAFRQGETLLILQPVSTLHPDHPWHRELSFNWQMDTLPGGTLSPAAGLRLALPRSTPERELAAFLFLRHALSLPSQTRFAAESAWFPLQPQAVAQSGLSPRYGRLYKAALLGPPYRGILLSPQAHARIERTLRSILQGAPIEASLSNLQESLGQ